MKLSDFRKKFTFNVNHNMADIRVCDIITKDYIFDFDVFLPSIGMNLQRGYVWNLQQKQSLIFSIIKETYIHKITVVKWFLNKKERKYIYKVIDGKQRLSTIISFIKNEFPIFYDKKYWRFCDLPKDIADCIRYYTVVADIGYSYPDNHISDSELIDWFELINFAGTIQDIQHLNRLKSSEK